MTETAKLYNHLRLFPTLADFKQWSRPLDDLDGLGGPIKPLTVSANGQVVPGTVGGIMPTIGGVAIDTVPAPLLTIPITGTRHVVLNISGTLVKQTYSGSSFVAAYMTTLSVSISVTTTAPAVTDGESTTGNFKLCLAEFVNGAKVLQNGYGPISLLVQDSLDGTGKGLLIPIYPQH